MKQRIFKVIFISILLSSILFGYYFLNCRFDVGIPCIIYSTTGHYCPGCGITRMLFALIRLDIKEAFMYNQLMFILLPFMVLGYLYYIYLYVTGKKDKILVRIPMFVWILLVASVLVFTICRNLPWFPFLRP